ncbi:MAG: CDP-glycerol glycerophosphotransferase family protein [Victivallaceae bacterium]
MWKLAEDKIKDKYEIVLYRDSLEEGEGLKHFVSKYRLISSSQVIVTTHPSYKPSKKHIHVQLWHGASIKKLGVMENKPGTKFKASKAWLRADYIMSYSETYTTFLNACMVTDPNKYIITGAPRNDFLFVSDGLANMRKIFGDGIENYRLVFFIPTFRDYYGKPQGDRNYDNPFGFDDFSPKEFDEFLEKNKCKIIFKPHPHDQALVLDYLHDYPLKNMLVLKDEALSENKLDLYELLNAGELLMTDYSSVYDDYLLLERPVLFIPVDISSYRENRGFVIESFEDWTPGPKVFDQKALQDEMSRCLTDKDYYSDQRKMIRNLQHRYKDGESSKRLWKFIDAVLTERK